MEFSNVRRDIFFWSFIYVRILLVLKLYILFGRRGRQFYSQMFVEVLRYFA